jgi:hypothetical protein
MRTHASPVALVATALACVLGGGVTAVATSARPSPVPPARPGHPGNPVVLDDAAFRVTGRAGSIVHVRLRTPLDLPAPGDTARYALTSTGTYAAVTLDPENGSGPGLQMATTTPAFACGKPECPNATLVAAAPGQPLPPGDYVLALAGPAGATVSFVLRGYAGTERMTTIRGTYAVPYTTGQVPVRTTHTPADAAYQTDGGTWTRPTIGRRMLAGVVLAVHPTQGGGYDYALCPGSYGARSAQVDLLATARPTCSGYTASLGSVVQRDPLAHPLPGSDDEYVNVSFAAATGTYEGVTGGSFAVKCNQPPCAYAAVAYVLALDS